MDDMALIAKFEQITGAPATDVIAEEDRLIFVVSGKHLGKAIGPRGSHVKKAAELFDKEIDIVEDADNPEDFVKNALSPARVDEVNIREQKNGRKVASVKVNDKDRGIAIGKQGRNVARARILAQRHFDVDQVVID
ncbi:MAG: NusA-like transcription termination signal-binding factor [Candidatus Lokiarchaeota archaeon]|jgi:N utilization substance protein A|nr:NusA-like transcription termination signal-binding factor [Candidatus Lokiarchaeota archaeon]